MVDNGTNSDWLVVGDSHQARMLQFHKKNGVDTISISGGQINHCFSVLRKLNLRNFSTIFVLAGGNDIAKLGKKVCGIVDEMRKLIQFVHSINANCRIFTGTAVPRGCGPDNGNVYIERMEMMDGMMRKFSPRHHHFLSDTFIAEPGLKGGPVSIMGEFYVGDRVHFNERGVAKYSELMAFVFHAANIEVFFDREEIRMRDIFRVVFWKF